MQYITCFTFSALMISTFMKRLAAAVVASHITITAGLHVYGKRKRPQEDDDFEESKVKGQGVCVCLYMWAYRPMYGCQWHYIDINHCCLVPSLFLDEDFFYILIL